MTRNAQRHSATVFREASFGSIPAPCGSILSLPEVHDEALFYLLFSLRAVTSIPPDNNLRPLRGDSLRTYARLAVAMTEDAVRSRPAVIRDSMQVYRVAALAFLDAQAALQVARTIPTPRFRERATAEVVAKLARFDSDGGDARGCFP